MTDEKNKENISLPVLKRRKHSKPRWVVLYAVQGLILVHIAVWLLSKKFGWFGGETLTPIEPSEGMEFVKNGVVNAGAIFFALALLSTFIFGRWFCGWGCHIVLLQDICFWMMRKIGVRPKPFRARWLMWFPFGLAVYMYIWPLFYRIALAPWLQPDLRWPEITTHLLTEDYWSSFVSPLLAIPFLLICGFATVYVLGAKGFCTYGCPYGGFFAPLDAISPMRVRVNDSCQKCGKCTAACTSNVRVHEEVDLYGMVIDTGCMKIMDCIDACPNEALSISFGTSALGKRTKKKTYDLSFGGEIFVSAFFLLGFFAFRGLYASVPMLMAVGMSLVGTWIVWKAYQVVAKPNASFHKTQLRFHGTMKPAGMVFLLTALLCFLFTLQSAMVGTCTYLGNAALANKDVESALWYYRLSGPITDGGIGLSSNPNVDMAMAKIYEKSSDFREAERLLWRIEGHVGDDERVTMLLGQTMQYHKQANELVSFYTARLSEYSQWQLVWEDYVGWLKREGMYEQAISASKEAVTNNPDAIRLQIQLVLLEIEFGDVESAIALSKQMTNSFPKVVAPWMLLSRALDASGDYDAARNAQTEAEKIHGER
ncbi:MAG: 4Fe-4S binding protein [Phycisphaerales bacterium]|nr:4Fe-4S binding protein [Phycisphaerales bacterium]